LCVEVEFKGRERLKEGFEDGLIDGSAGNVLANGHAILLTKIIAEVVSRGRVLDHHLMSALATIDQPVEERLPGSRETTSFVAIVFGMVVTQHGLDFLKGLPRNIGRIFVIDANFPVFHREAFAGWPVS
jgi:hypothetical protein